MAKQPSLFESAAALHEMMEFHNKLRPLRLRLAALLQAAADSRSNTAQAAEIRAILNEIESHEPELARLTEKHQVALQFAAESD
jgi:hypothetical protein